jgi:hypothetical protein
MTYVLNPDPARAVKARPLLNPSRDLGKLETTTGHGLQDAVAGEPDRYGSIDLQFFLFQS